MTKVNIRFFGPLRDITRKDEIEIEFPAICTGETVFEQLAVVHPELRKWRQSVRLAVNLEYTQFSNEVHDGDEVCFIPPVSGG